MVSHRKMPENAIVPMRKKARAADLDSIAVSLLSKP
jgi:hypothetical protein